MQEVVAEENTTLQQQEQEANTVPEDAGLLYGQQAVLVPAQHLLGCGTGTSTGKGCDQGREHGLGSGLWGRG